MSNKNIPALLIIPVILVCLLSGCAGHSEELPEYIPPAQMYNQAITNMTAFGDLALSIRSVKLVTLDTQVFQENVEQTLSFQDYSTDSPSVDIQQTYIYPDYSFSCRHRYADGTAYLSLDANTFSTKVPYSTYAEQIFPLSFLDPQIYEHIEAKRFANRTLIGFSKPSGPEKWAFPQGAEFEDATGSVLLDSSGNFIKGSYSITYTGNAATVQTHYTIIPAETILPELDADWDNALPIQDIQAPLILERSCALLSSSAFVHGDSLSRITCQLGTFSRTQQTNLTLDSRSELTADITQEVSLTDGSRPGELFVSRQTESFRSGVYTVRSDSAEAIQEAVTAEIMEQYCRNLLVSSIPLPHHLEDAFFVHSGTKDTLTFKVSEAFAHIISAAACESIYQDPALLDTLASNYHTIIITCSLLIDPVTGLPGLSTLTYEGVYEIDGQSYVLTSLNELIYLYQ